MNTKLTLRLDDKLIASAKRHSAESGKSVSQLVSDFFALIDAQERRRYHAPRPLASRRAGRLRFG
jgi:hypothetical protein